MRNLERESATHQLSRLRLPSTRQVFLDGAKVSPKRKELTMKANRLVSIVLSILVVLVAIQPAVACDGWCCPSEGGNCYQPSGENCFRHDVLYCSALACSINCLSLHVEADTPKEVCMPNSDGTWTGEVEVVPTITTESSTSVGETTGDLDVVGAKYYCMTVNGCVFNLQGCNPPPAACIGCCGGDPQCPACITSSEQTSP